MSDVHRTIIIPAGMVNAARQLGSEIAPGGHGMFITGLSPTGNEPATHYVSSGLIDSDFAAILNSGLMIHNAAIAGAAAQGMEKKATQQQAIDLKSQAQVHTGKRLVDGAEVDEGPHEYIARMGLKIIQGTV